MKSETDKYLGVYPANYELGEYSRVMAENLAWRSVAARTQLFHAGVTFDGPADFAQKQSEAICALLDKQKKLEEENKTLVSIIKSLGRRKSRGLTGWF